MKYRIPLNLPNILSLYRLCSFPFILIIAWKGNEGLFVLLLCINLITDILDGLIARVFNLMTEMGAKIDSLADVGTYILAFLGIGLFKWEEFQPHLFSFLLFISLFLVCNVLSLIKFGRFPSLHLYSWKIGGYIQGIFFFILFVFEFYTPLYFFMITWGILSFIEHLMVQFILPEMRSNSKGIYWVLKERGSIARK